VVAQAKAAFTRRVPGELAALVFDSAVDTAPQAGQRTLRFEHANGWIDALVRPEDGWYDVHVRAEPKPVAAQLELETQDIALVDQAGAGHFTCPKVPRGLMRIRLTGLLPEPVHSDWFRL
jgi:hypothetical protein